MAAGRLPVDREVSKSGKIEAVQIQHDKHLVSAGECFMFLCWVESTMRDFVTLKEGGEDMRRQYNQAYGRENHPREFSRRRLELGRYSFGRIKNRFLCMWPEWKERNNIREAIERAVICRNGFGHAQVQPFRPYLLYTPSVDSWETIEKYTRCHKCRRFHKDCECTQDDLAEPRTLIFRCLDDQFIDQFYGDIQTIDLDCFLPTARSLSIAYRGVAWPREKGYVIGEYRPLSPTQSC